MADNSASIEQKPPLLNQQVIYSVLISLVIVFAWSSVIYYYYYRIGGCRGWDCFNTSNLNWVMFVVIWVIAIPVLSQLVYSFLRKN